MIVEVTEVYPHFGNACAVDASGRRFLLNSGTKGAVDYVVGQVFDCVVSERNYVVEIRPSTPTGEPSRLVTTATVTTFGAPHK